MVLGVRPAIAFRCGQSWRCGLGCVAVRERLHLAGQLGPHANQRLEQLDASALGGWRAEDRLGVLEAGVPAERHVAKAEHREQADARFYAASTEYSEHRRIVGTAPRTGPNC